MQIMLLLLLLGLGACRPDGTPALTHEQAQVLEATLVDITPELLRRVPDGGLRKQLEADLRRLQRAINAGTPDQLLSASAKVRALAGDSLDQGLALVLSEAEAAARRQQRQN